MKGGANQNERKQESESAKRQSDKSVRLFFYYRSFKINSTTRRMDLPELFKINKFLFNISYTGLQKAEKKDVSTSNMLISLNNTKVKRWGDASARAIDQLLCVVYLSFQSWLLNPQRKKKPDISQNKHL